MALIPIKIKDLPRVKTMSKDDDIVIDQAAGTKVINAGEMIKSLNIKTGTDADFSSKSVFFEVRIPTSTLVIPGAEKVYSVPALYVASARQGLNYGYTYSPTTSTITLAERITQEDIDNTEEGFILVEAVCVTVEGADITSLTSILASSSGASHVGTSFGTTVEEKLKDLDNKVAEGSDTFAVAYNGGQPVAAGLNSFVVPYPATSVKTLSLGSALQYDGLNYDYNPTTKTVTLRDGEVTLGGETLVFHVAFKSIEGLLPNAMQGFSFQAGARLGSVNDHIYDPETKSWWFWAGAYPKTVNAGDKPVGEGWCPLGRRTVALGSRLAAYSNEVSLVTSSGTFSAMPWVGVEPSGVVSDITQNAHGGWDVTTSSGVFEYVSTENYNLRINGQLLGFVTDRSDATEGIRMADEYCVSEGLTLKGSGTFYFTSEVTLNSRVLGEDFSLIPKLVEPDLHWPSETCVNLTRNRIGVGGFRVMNDLRVNSPSGLLVGIRVDVPEMVCNQVIATKFPINWQITSYSCTLNQCQGINGETGLSAYSPSFQREINTLSINGGDWFNNSRYSLDIGDDRFPTTIPTNQYHGYGINITGKPRFDGTTMRIDRVIAVQFEGYFEKGPSSKTVCIELGGAFEGSVRGFTMRNTTARDYDYVVKCFNAVSGIIMEGNAWAGIRKCALYLVSDIYSYIYRQNDSLTTVFWQGKPVHTGVRAARSTNPFASKTLSTHGLYDGVQNVIPASGETYFGARIISGRGVLTYNGTNQFRLYVEPATNISGTLSNSGVITLDTKDECYKFNGGDALIVGSSSTYIRYVDYDNGLVIINSTTIPQGPVTISQVKATPHLDGRGYERPTDLSYQPGSVVWNMGTVTATPAFWVLKNGAWASV